MNALESLDSGQGGIDWNSLFGRAIDTAGQVAAIKAQTQNQTPVPYYSPVQVDSEQASLPTMWLVLGAVAIFAVARMSR